MIDWAESVALNTARRNGRAFAALERHFSVPEIVELTVVAAHRIMVSRIQEALWTDLEGPEVPANTRAEMTGEVLEDYIDTVLGAGARGAGRAEGCGRA